MSPSRPVMTPAGLLALPAAITRAGILFFILRHVF